MKTQSKTQCLYELTFTTHRLVSFVINIVFFFVYFTASSLGFFYKIFFFKKKYYSTKSTWHPECSLAKMRPLEGMTPAVIAAVLSSAVPAAPAAVRSPARVAVSLIALVSSILITIAI
jgi:hypothetical protein